jgi:alcohol dehydrogenase (cytochrome c)
MAAILAAGPAFGQDEQLIQQEPSAVAPAPVRTTADGLTPVTDEMLQAPDPADWLMWRRTLDSHGYSPLDQIDGDNVANIRMTWTRGLPEGSMEGTPLVHDGVLFFPNPNDIVQAIDAVTGDLIWEYRRENPDDLGDYLPAPDINRNLAIYDGLIIDTSADNQLFALDAATGELVWETRIAPYQSGSQQTSGPIIANGKVISGRGCEPEGGPQACVVTAHDAMTGQELWRRSTIPAPGEPNYESWGDLPYEERVHVGTWMVPSFDPELNLIYTGTSVTMPAPKYQLAGNDLQYLYHNSTLALDADTGEIVWWYQHVVDHWDIDHPFERLIVETEIAPDPEAVAWINPDIEPGETRKVITGIPGKSGIVYTLDAETGEFLWARPTVHQTLVSDIDGKTGRVTNNPDMIMYEDGARVTACPSAQGGKNWQAGAYSPLTGAMYFPLQNTCSEITAVPGGLYGIRTRGTLAPGAESVGSIHAIDVATGRTAWTFQNRAPMMSLLTTGGSLLFGGDGNGRFRALDQETGEVLWEINLGSAVTGFPVTYSVDGKQYVAVATGTARTALAPELRPSATNNLFVFTLP